MTWRKNWKNIKELLKECVDLNGTEGVGPLVLVTVMFCPLLVTAMFLKVLGVILTLGIDVVVGFLVLSLVAWAGDNDHSDWKKDNNHSFKV